MEGRKKSETDKRGGEEEEEGRSRGGAGESGDRKLSSGRGTMHQR